MEQPKAYSYIRFSSLEQEKGNSKERQEAAAAKYCKEHGLTLDASTKISDLGMSAFRGKHKTHGALSGFLQLVQNGNVPAGSILIVESLDRLSREEVDEAYDQFRKILNAGIKIVTLQDGMEYTKEGMRNNLTQLLISIMNMARAFGESDLKSKRVSAAWESKRKKLQEGAKLTKKLPVWIKTNKKGKFEVVQEVKKAIEYIFQRKLEGAGKGAIMKELNQHPDMWKPAKAKTNPITGKLNSRNKLGGWQESYIQKLLTNRELIGEFQPHKVTGGKREPIGEPIPGYFPPVIDTGVFSRVKALMEFNNDLALGGPTGKALNLFTGTCQCGICKSPMHYINKGPLPKGGQYLHCSNNRRGTGECPAKPIRYDEFEILFFEKFDEVDINKLLPGEDETLIAISQIQDTIKTNEAKIKEFERAAANWDLLIAKEVDPDRLGSLNNKAISAIKNQKELAIENNRLKIEMGNLSKQYEELKNNRGAIKGYREKLASCKTEGEQINLRLKIRMEIQRVFEWVEIYPPGYVPDRVSGLKEKYNKGIEGIDKTGKITLHQKMKIDAIKNILGQELEGVHFMQNKFIARYKIRGGHIGTAILKSWGDDAG